MSYVLSVLAMQDLRAAVLYVAERHNVESAEILQEGILKSLQRLAEFPNIGHDRRDLTDHRVQFWRVSNYLVVYRPETRPLEVLRILHCARDIESILDGE